MRRRPIVCWGQPPLRFALSSKDDSVIARASLIFGPWSAPVAGAPPQVWHVDPVAGVAKAWRITGSSCSGPLTRESAWRAVSAVEFLAIQNLRDTPSASTLHGALVARQGRGVILVGQGEAGKSTLACALWERGWTLLGDDIALLDAGSGRAWAAPRRVALREASRGLLGDGLWHRVLATRAGEEVDGTCLFNPHEVDGRDRTASVPLAAIVFLDRPRRPAGSGATRLPPAQALLAMLPYSNLAVHMDAGRAIRRLQPVVERVGAWDLTRGPLSEMIAAVEAALAAAD